MNRRDRFTIFDGRSTNPHHSRYNLHHAPETETNPVKHPKHPYSNIETRSLPTDLPMPRSPQLSTSDLNIDIRDPLTAPTTGEGRSRNLFCALLDGARPAMLLLSFPSPHDHNKD
ncbi:hypothetical protein Bca4012_038636 [Brassica carinata]